MNKIQSQMQKLRKDLQTEGILPYEEEEDYWKSYEGVSSCEEGVKKCV